jgi:Sec-independent protein translocase protein TatA
MGIGWAEGLLLLLIAALFLKGDEFTTAARTLGRWMGQAQKMSRSFMDELQREARDSGLDDSVSEVRKALNRKATGTKGRPLDRLLTELEGPEEAKPDPAAPEAQAGDSPGNDPETPGAGQSGLP